MILKDESEACDQWRKKPPKQKQSQLLFCPLLPCCHGNAMHEIKIFDRSIRILPKSGISLLILPDLGQALLGNPCAFSHRQREKQEITPMVPREQLHRNLR